MTTQIEELKRLAMAATPGPWETKEDEWGGKEEAWCYWHKVGPFSLMGKELNNDSSYITAASPDVVLALIAQNQELATSLREFMELPLRGHTIADRLQFSSAGREILGRANSALAKVGK